MRVEKASSVNFKSGWRLYLDENLSLAISNFLYNWYCSMGLNSVTVNLLLRLLFVKWKKNKNASSCHAAFVGFPRFIIDSNYGNLNCDFFGLGKQFIRKQLIRKNEFTTQ